MSFPQVPRDLNVPQNRRNANLNSVQSRKSRTTRQDVVDLVVSGTQTVKDLTSSDNLHIESTKAGADAILIEASNASGGVGIVAGSTGASVTTNGDVSIYSANTLLSSTTKVCVGTTTNAASTVYVRNGSTGTNTRTCISTSITNATTVMTRAMIYGGIIECTSSGGAVALTTDTAALIVGGLSSPAVGDTLEVQLVNVGANSVTITAGTGVTTFGSLTIAGNTSRILRFKLTNVTASSEAVRLTL
uniref:Uncharacterized protein n=1 Tax=Clandestinovirus TaxID=2831644 RepID=A0A8F8KL69_9VIRU|nr:hypothetical protein KOM_12_119 [Clandestinovirus]